MVPTTCAGKEIAAGEAKKKWHRSGIDGSVCQVVKNTRKTKSVKKLISIEQLSTFGHSLWRGLNKNK